MSTSYIRRYSVYTFISRVKSYNTYISFNKYLRTYYIPDSVLGGEVKDSLSILESNLGPNVISGDTYIRVKASE